MAHGTRQFRASAHSPRSGVVLVGGGVNPRMMTIPTTHARPLMIIPTAITPSPQRGDIFIMIL